MDIYRVALIGHRTVENSMEIENSLTRILGELIRTHDFIEFQIGRNGDFDMLAASCIKRAKKCHPCHCALSLVLPYSVADMTYYEQYYDSIFIPKEVETSHFKSAITKRNQWLVDHSDFLIAYVTRPQGGAYATVCYAKKQGKRIVNLAEL